jgi:hypothetical protein
MEGQKGQNNAINNCIGNMELQCLPKLSPFSVLPNDGRVGAPAPEVKLRIANRLRIHSPVKLGSTILFNVLLWDERATTILLQEAGPERTLPQATALPSCLYGVS